MAFLAPAALAAGALKGALGVGLGFGASRIGENEDYDLSNGILDFGLGAIGLPGFSAAKGAYRGGRMAYGVANTGGAKGAGSGLLNIARIGRPATKRTGLKYMGKAGALATIPHTAGDWGLGSVDGKQVQGPVIAKQGPWQGPMLVPGMGGGISLPTVQPVPVRFQASQAPTFNKTLADYLADKDLNRLVGQQIVQMNTPLVHANKAENVKRNRKVNTNKQLGASLQASYAKALADQAVSNAADIERNANRAALLKQQTADAEAQVPITYLEGEASKAKGEASSAMANEQSMADQLVNRLASQGQQYLEQLKNAEASQTRVNEQAVNNAADDAIRANVAQVRANQAQRGSLLGTLAAEQYKNAIDLYNTGVGNFNQAEDRRFNQAVKNAELLNTANLASAELGIDAVKSASGDGKPTAQDKRGNARLLELQKALDKKRTAMVDDPTGKPGQVPYSSTPSGKKEIAKLRKRIAVVKDRYKTGPL